MLRIDLVNSTNGATAYIKIVLLRSKMEMNNWSQFVGKKQQLVSEPVIAKQFFIDHRLQ
jgi:hypothetical protein